MLPPGRVRGRALRAVVVLGVVCSVSHLLLTPLHAAHHPLGSVLGAVTAFACLSHLGRLRRRPTPAGWAVTLGLAVVVLGHQHLLGGSAAAAPGSTARAAATVTAAAGHHAVAVASAGAGLFGGAAPGPRWSSSLTALGTATAMGQVIVASAVLLHHTTSRSGRRLAPARGPDSLGP